MQRRDFFRGALALPTLAALPGWAAPLCRASGTCPSVSKPFHFILQGPFGLKLQNPPNVTGITAFMPIDPSKRHQFAMGGQPQTASKEFNFELHQVKPPSSLPQLCIDKAFSSFCAEHTTWAPAGKRRLLTIDLPVPNSIIPLPKEKPLTVTFQSSTQPKSLYRTFVLEYDLAVSDLELLETSSGLKIAMGVNEYYVEVGLDHKDPDDTANSHAMNFYNKSLLPFFPDLQTPEHILATISESPLEHQTHANPECKDFYPETTTTFECKAGGIIGGSP